MIVEISVNGVDAFRRKLDIIERKVSDMRPGFDEAYKRFREIQQTHFATGGSGPSGPWKPLKQNTVAYKARMGHDPRTLHRSLLLRRSLTTLRGTGTVYRRNRAGLFMGTRVPYARYHQTGTEKMVARPPVDLHEQDRREIVNSIRDWVVA